MATSIPKRVLLAALGTLLLAAETSKMPADFVRWLETTRPGDKAEVIVQFRNGPDKAENAKVAALGGAHLRTLRVINSGVYRIPANKLKTLAADEEVLRISPNRGVSTQSKQQQQTNTSVLVEGDR